MPNDTGKTKGRKSRDAAAAERYSTVATPRKFPTVYPMVASIVTPNEHAAGQFIGSRPQGVTVHYSADRDLQRVIRTLHERGLNYHLIIDREGKVHQLCYLDRRVNHAGPSLWRQQSCNRWHAAVCILNWGQLKKGAMTWNDIPLPAEDIARRPENVSFKMTLWDAATPAQEASLLMVLRWFVAMKVDPRNIVGHDESAIPPGRKVDPGGALSWTMEDLRNSLCDEAGIPHPT